MNVPLLDLVAQYEILRDEIDAAVRRVMTSQKFVLGEEVEAFEQELAAFVGVPHAIGVASGTDALLLALRASGIGPGDEVLIPTFSFFATAGAVVNAGGIPVFVDIDPEDYCLDPDLAEAGITPRTRAILPVHLYGQCAAMDRLADLATRHSLILLEDAAQSLGAAIDGCAAGSLSLAGCFSFFPTKNLGGAGDGGMVTTGDSGLASLIRMLRTHGAEQDYRHSVVGYNSRLDALQAAVLRAKLPHLEEWNQARQRNARIYEERFLAAGFGGAESRSEITLPFVRKGRSHVFHQYVIRASRRDELRKALGESGIGTGLYYPLALHQQQCFQKYAGPSGSFENAERACREVLALPIYPELAEAQIDAVVQAIAHFYGV